MVARRFDILADRIGQPQKIIRTACAHTPVRRRMPPVKNIAFLELVRGAGEDMGARPCGIGVKQSQHILQLIAEAEGSARLIEPRPRKNPR